LFGLVVAYVLIDHQMVIIDVQIYKHIVENVLLNRRSGMNIIIEKLKAYLGLLKRQLAPYNLWMIDQMIIKLLQLI
jgi:hypothetical protein